MTSTFVAQIKIMQAGGFKREKSPYLSCNNLHNCIQQSGQMGIKPNTLLVKNLAWVAELVDARDLKSLGL